MERLAPLEKDYYCVEEGQSDKEYESDSSDDEVQKMMRGIAGVSRESKKREINEFEQEMEKELTSAFEFQKSGWTYNQTGTKADEKVVVTTKEESTTNLPSTSKRKENSDDDDDDDDDENALRLVEKITDSDEEFCQQEGVNVKSNDRNLFYNPKEDEDNQNWVDTHRQSYQATSQRLPRSDAVLNCPCCMGVLCYDCQRHEVYNTQYRAMFVSNCIVQNNYVLFQPRNDRRKQQKTKNLKLKSGQKLTLAPEGCDTKGLFRPVVCEHCKTEVAVYDSDEVYHFFNVLASFA